MIATNWTGAFSTYFVGCRDWEVDNLDTRLWLLGWGVCLVVCRGGPRSYGEITGAVTYTPINNHYPTTIDEEGLSCLYLKFWGFVG